MSHRAATEIGIQLLTQQAVEVNKLSNQITERVSVIEATINSLNLGVPWRIQTDRDDIDFWLGYERVGGAWGLSITTGKLEASTVPWKSASRELRLASIELIPRLIDELTVEANRLSMEIHSKILALQDIMARIGV